jgi:hypothetical protein
MSYSYIGGSTKRSLIGINAPSFNHSLSLNLPKLQKEVCGYAKEK